MAKGAARKKVWFDFNNLDIKPSFSDIAFPFTEELDTEYFMTSQSQELFQYYL